MTATSPLFGIVCDDIRREDNGKTILIGIYSDKILLKEFPFHLGLYYWIVGRSKLQELSMEVKIEVHSESTNKLLMEASVKIKMEAVEPRHGEETEFNIPVGPIVHMFEEDSVLNVKVKGVDDLWTTITTKSISLLPNQ